MQLSDVPIVQAPMAGGPSTPALAAAVSSAGGYGFVAGGYLSPAELRETVRATRVSSGAPFGVNLFVPSSPGDAAEVAAYAEELRPDADRLGVALGTPVWDDDAFEAKVDVIEEERVDLVSFTFGCPTEEMVDRLHGSDCKVAVTVTSEAEASLAEASGADVLVVQGTESGGHQSAFLDLDADQRPLLSLLAGIRESVHVPFVGSGGVMSGVDLAAVLDAGAVAAQMGTAFLCTQEAGTSPIYRRALLDGRYPETIVTRAYSGRFARGLANEFGVAHSRHAPRAYPEVHHLTRPLRAAAATNGDASVPNLWAGTGWRQVTSESARSLVRRVASEAQRSTG
ncbi:MAG: nitronate monooxygenase [Acidimicrobiales bacterium]